MVRTFCIPWFIYMSSLPQESYTCNDVHFTKTFYQGIGIPLWEAM
jgi:hypothetical protein